MDVELLQFLIFISFQNNIYHIVTWNGYSKWPLNEANELTVRWIDNREWSGRVRKRRKKTPQEHWWWILWLNMGPEFQQTKTWIDSPALMAGWWLQYFLFSISYMGCHPSHIILPIDELIFFKMGTLHHQPGGVNIERDSQNLSGGIVVPIHRIKKSWTRTGDTWITGRQINVRYPAW